MFGADVLTEREATIRLRTKGFMGVCVSGGAAGCIAAYASGEGWALLPISSVLLALLGNIAGGFLGLFLRNMLRRSSLNKNGGDINTEASLVLSAYGGFLGTVSAMALGMADTAHWWAVGGSMSGAIIAGVMGDLLGVLVFLMALSSMDEAGRARAMEKAVRKSREALLEVDDRPSS